MLNASRERFFSVGGPPQLGATESRRPSDEREVAESLSTTSVDYELFNRNTQLKE